MKYLILLAALVLAGCSVETNEQEAARLEKAERAAGYPEREGLRPGSTANF